ncbi:MAG: Gp49 family protein [Leptothrix sp. (in: b-proteobacteria)]
MNIEHEIQAKGLTAPRVTPADIEANIAHTEIVKHISPSGQVLRWAVLTTRNGFAVAGRPSAAASSANDNADIGEKVAIENAKQELWPLMGYELRTKLQGTLSSFLDRLYFEVAELDDRIKKLKSFTLTDKFSQLDKEEQGRMHSQLAAMLDYMGCLDERVKFHRGQAQAAA